MRLVSVNSLKGNEVLGRPIYDESGRILLSKDVKLMPAYIERLINLGIHSIYIDDAISMDVEIDDNISEKTRQMSKHAVKKMVEKYVRDGTLNNDGIIKSVNSIIDEILDQKDVMFNVLEIRAKDDYLFSHSVNVCVLAVILGIHMGYNMQKLKEVAIGALLHDVGKIKLLKEQKESIEIINIEKLHPKVGFDLLGSNNSFSAVANVAVLMHHEHVDGSGYPLGLKGNEIHEVAKLITICNVFDNMVSGNKDMPIMHVYEVMEYLTAMSGYLFDKDIVSKFVEHIAAYPSGSGVILNTNEMCLVIRQNKDLPMRPVLKVIYDKNGNKVDEPYEIDLIKELTLLITGVYDL
ncbi:MAG: HD domain-containing protein [Paenibacillaceae bacterium]|nr:HD domain-containing protein [Paenibacillaceae bacterium]